MKKMAAIVIFLLASLSGNAASAAVPDRIVVADTPVPSAAPIIVQGQTLVSAGALADALHATVSWDARAKTATFSQGAETVKLTVGQKTAVLSGYPRSGSIKLAVPVLNRSGRLYAPVRFLAELWGYHVALTNGIVSIQPPIGAEQQNQLRAGDLSAARELAISLAKGSRNVRFSTVPLSYTNDREGYSLDFVFPKGKADRFFTIVSGVVSYYELKNGFLTVTWQAHLPVGQKSDIEQLMDGKITDATGGFPTAGPDFYYYREGSLASFDIQECGSASSDGQVARIGYVTKEDGKVVQQTGSIVYQLDAEVQPSS